MGWLRDLFAPKKSTQTTTEGFSLSWSLGPITTKSVNWVAALPHPPQPTPESEFALQLTADQQVRLSVTGQDKYGNTVDITGNSVWKSSDESIVQVQVDKSGNTQAAIAFAVGPIGTAAVTFTNDTNMDGSGDFMGSLAIDVVGGEMAEVVINPGNAEAKGSQGNKPDQGLPPGSPGSPDQGLPPTSGGSPDQGLPGSGGTPDQGLPGSGGQPDQGLPPTSGGSPDQGLPGDRPQGPPPQGGSGNRPSNELPGQPSRPNRPGNELPGSGDPGVETPGNELPGQGGGGSTLPINPPPSGETLPEAPPEPPPNTKPEPPARPKR
jgi:hypothetical protein